MSQESQTLPHNAVTPRSRKLRRTALIAVPLIAAAILVACGGGSGGTTPPPPAPTYTVGGTVTGLTISGLVLQNNQGSDISVNADATFTFSAQTNSSAYVVSVKTQPSGNGQQQTCTVANGSGTLAGSNVSNIAVSCVTTACPQLTQSLPASSASSIVAYDFVSSSTAPNSQFDVKYKVRFQNTEPGLKAASGTATAASGVSVVDGTAAFGDVGIYTTVVSSDDITLRQSAACATSAPALTWNVSSTVDASSQAGLLQGEATQFAMSATRDFVSTTPIAATLVDYSISPLGVVRNEIVIRFRANATVGAVNAILRSQKAQIIGMTRGGSFLILLVPERATGSELEQLAVQLRSDPVIADAYTTSPANPPAVLPAPENMQSYDPSLRSTLSDLLTMRSPSAWNAASAFRTRQAVSLPNLIVPDYYGSGGTGPGLSAYVSGISTTSIDCVANRRFGTAFSHGIAVLSKLVSSFGVEPGSVTVPAPRQLLTSVLPLPPDVRADVQAIDLCVPNGLLDDDRVQALTVIAIRQAELSGKKIVINSSRGQQERRDSSENPIPYTPTQLSLITDEYGRRAARWLTRLRDGVDPSLFSARERAIVFVVAAGNMGRSRASATASSEYSFAGLVAPRDPVTGTTLARASNTLVVENAMYSVSNTRELRRTCLNDSSSIGGNISAIASDIEAGRWNDSLTARIADGGTSLAAPHVAGTAALLWTIRPELTSVDVVNRILGGADRRIVCSTQVANGLDIYGAVLSLDETLIVNSSPVAPVRRAILDFNEDGAFNLTDVDAFAKAFATATSNAPPDYGRADLNGDGYTGGTKVAAFNLNANRNADESPNIEPSVNVLVPPPIGTIDPFNENQLTDYSILCWYIYSPLYTGDDDRSLADATLRSNRLPGCTQRMSANLVTWVYTVTITNVNQLALNPTYFPRPPQVGETYTLTQVFDPATPDSDTRAIFGRYVGANRTFTLEFTGCPAIVLRSEEFPVTNPTNNWIAIDNDDRGNTDQFRAAMEGSTTARTLRIRLYGTPVNTFTSDAMLLIPPDPNLFSIDRSAYFAVLGSSVTGRIESIVVR